MSDLFHDVSALCELLEGKQIHSGETSFSGYATDTRKELKGKLFIALRGDSYDAHRFLAQAIEKEPHVILIDDDTDLPDQPGKTSVILVKDTLVALQKYASEIRRLSSAKYFAITGSNGKTSTRGFLASLLGDGSFCNKGSFNNHWGVPFTLLDAGLDHKNVIVEMGMNHAGEISRLVEIATPDFVCVTNVGRAHLEFFSGMDSLAKAKEEIYTASIKESAEQIGAVFNLDNPWTKKMWSKLSPSFGQVKTFSLSESTADVLLNGQNSSRGILISGVIGGEKGEVEVPIIGSHNVENLAAAAAMALMGGVTASDIWKRMTDCRAEWGRNMLISHSTGAQILFDGYNANPDSMMAFADVLGSLTPPKKIAVLGQMMEVGEDSEKLHSEVGARLAKISFEKVLVVGPSAKPYLNHFDPAICRYVDSAGPEVKEFLYKNLSSDHLIAVKGSRGNALENIFDDVPELS